MKKVFFLLFAALTIGAVAHAQDGDRMAKMREKQKQMLKDSVNLPDDKIEKVLAVQEEFRPKQREIFMDQTLDREAKEAKLKELRQEQAKKLKGVLSEEEFKRLEEFQERQIARMGAGGRGRPGGN